MVFLFPSSCFLRLAIFHFFLFPRVVQIFLPEETWFSTFAASLLLLRFGVVSSPFFSVFFRLFSVEKKKKNECRTNVQRM